MFIINIAGFRIKVILNPGSTTDSSYFSIADIIVTEEEYYDKY